MKYEEAPLDDDILQRQVALVSYGNKFLRRELTLAEFHRHGVFFGKRLLFRTPGDNALLADDFTLWLAILRELGACRLSLHHARQFKARASGDGQVVVAHYPAHCELWTCGEEPASWWSHPALPKGGYAHGADVPSAACYGGAIDTYWRAEEIEGSIAVPGTNWEALAGAIAGDLQLSAEAAKEEGFFVYTGDAPDWAQFPLFPFTEHAPLPHQLLKVLSDAQASFANNTHCKNEGSYFMVLAGDALEQKMQWGRRLEQWLLDLQLHCANDIGTGEAPVAALPQLPGPVAQAPAPASDDSARPRSKWFKAGMFLLLFALLSLLVQATSDVIAGHSWLSPALGLAFAIAICAKSTKA